MRFAFFNILEWQLTLNINACTKQLLTAFTWCIYKNASLIRTFLVDWIALYVYLDSWGPISQIYLHNSDIFCNYYTPTKQSLEGYI